ncbi:MAG: M20 family metallopeptidase [Firmicutes bacterium]|nr:M20 family metallopeptidase [Bacillota bacterium]
MARQREFGFLQRLDANLVTGVCRDLVRINTVNPPGDEKAAAEYVVNFLGRYGFEGRLLEHGDSRATALCRLRGRGDAPAVVFNGHLDVVPAGTQKWAVDPFEGTIQSSRVWGRGSADMKGGLAAMMVALKAIAEAGPPLRGDIVLTATAGEEVDMSGAKALVVEHDLAGAQAIIIAEPTDNRIGVAERGLFWLEITTCGKTAHGSTPHLGKNAIMMMLPLLQRLDRLDIPFTRHPLLGGFTRSINTIAGGVKTNVVPDRCVATVDMRTVPGQSHAGILEQVERLLSDAEATDQSFRGSVRAVHDLPAVETAPDHPAVRLFIDAVAGVTGQRLTPGAVPFATEAAVFVPALGAPSIICGPGDPALAHQPDEYVEIDKMLDAARIYVRAVERMLL